MTSCLFGDPAPSGSRCFGGLEAGAVFCCVDLGFPLKQPSGPNTWGRFRGFSNDLGHLWAPSSFPGCSCVVEPASSRPAGHAKPGGICKNKSHQCFCALVHVKTREPFLERGPGLTCKPLIMSLVMSHGTRTSLGKTFRVSVQQRRESWCGCPWLVKAPPLALLSLQPSEELGAGVPHLLSSHSPPRDNHRKHSAWNPKTELQP